MPRALIVDDKPDNLYYLEALLRGNWYSVERAANGVEALASARANPPDLIITDILMPGMDGFTLCRHWKQDPRLQRIPFVFYTATYTDPKDEQLAMSLGADLFLIKPQEPEAFVRQIASVLRQHQDGELLTPPAAPMEESTYLREYNAALVRKLEGKLVQLERTSKVKDIFLGSVSHQLRTPLTPVALLAGLLIDDPNTPPHIRKDLEIIRRNVEIEKRLISDLLDYAALQCGRLRLQSQSLSLHAIVQQAIALWQGQIQAKRLHLELCLEARLDQISGDRNLLEQVLWSLLHNAVRRNPKGGPITLRSWNPREDCIAVQVRDAGKLMDAETIAWIFSPFEGESRLGERNMQDLDLGMAVSKGIVEAHSGDIGIESKGQPPETAVTIELPLYCP